MRLEDGIIATLNAASDFKASPNWRGKYSPEHKIAQSGLWLVKGLYGTPLSESEYAAIETYSSGKAPVKDQASKSVSPPFPTRPSADVIKNWLRTRTTLEFLGTWEVMYNPDFKVVDFDHFRANAGLHTFALSAKEWCDANTELAQSGTTDSRADSSA